MRQKVTKEEYPKLLRDAAAALNREIEHAIPLYRAELLKQQEAMLYAAEMIERQAREDG